MTTSSLRRLTCAVVFAALATLLLSRLDSSVIQAQTANPTAPPPTTAPAVTVSVTALSPPPVPASPTTTAAAPTTSATGAATLAATSGGTAAATSGAPPTFTIDGSKIVSPILTQATSAYSAQHPDVKASIAISGTSGGLDKLCSGTVDMAMANSGITDQQIAACTNNKVQFVELLLGFDAATIVVNSSSKITCLSTDEVTKLLSPSAVGKFQNWNQLAEGTSTPQADQPLTTIYATNDTRARDLISTLIPGGTLRPDITALADGPTVVDKVVADANSIAILTLSDAQTAQNNGKSIRAVDLKNGNVCTTANAINLANGRYPAGESLYLYVNVSALDRKPVSDFLNFLVSADGQKFVTSATFTVADQTAYTRDQTYLTSRQTGRTFSLIESVNVAADTTGTVNVAGDPASHTAIQAVSDAFKQSYAQITVTQTLFGDDTGFTKLCAGSVDLIGTTRLPTDAEQAACKANNIQPIQLTLGADGVVLLINPGNNFATCLTTDQLAKLFGSASDSKVMKWSDVSSQFPATDLLLLTPNDGSIYTDLLLQQTVKGVAPLPRLDVTQNDDPLYRAAGTVNVAGAITYMGYADYQKVQQAGSKAVVVQVNGGKGCVAPTDKTLLDGSYPLSQQVYLFLNPVAFSRPEVKAFVWYLLSDDALAVLSSKSNLTGLDRQGFITARDTALKQFSQTPTPTVTPTALPTSPVVTPKP